MQLAATASPSCALSAARSAASIVAQLGVAVQHVLDGGRRRAPASPARPTRCASVAALRSRRARVQLAAQQREQARLAAAVRTDQPRRASPAWICSVASSISRRAPRASPGSGTGSRGRCLRFRRSRILAGAIRHTCVNARRHGIRHNPHPLAGPGHPKTRSARLDDPTQPAETGDAPALGVRLASRNRSRCFAAGAGPDASRFPGVRDERFAEYRRGRPGAGRRALRRRFSSSSLTGALFYRVGVDGTSADTLYQFGITDGVGPAGALLLGSDNLFYGTAQFSNGGSAVGSGTIFRIAPDGTGFIRLHQFAPSTTSNVNSNPINTDGSSPNRRAHRGQRRRHPVWRSALWRTGGHRHGLQDRQGRVGLCGVARICRGHLGRDGDNRRCDGAHPRAGLVESAGYLYGTTFTCGATGQGTIFRLALDGSDFSVLHVFTTPTAPSGSTVT